MPYFFAASDGIVNETLLKFLGEVQIPEAHAVSMVFQIMVENIHQNIFLD